MSTRKLALALFLTTSLGFLTAQAQKPAAPAAPAGNCKTFGTGRCCEPAVTAHLSKDAIFSACGKSDAVYLGEQGSKDTCKYFFKVEGEKDSEMYVQVQSSAVKGAAPSVPPDPFATWKKASGKVMIAQPKNLSGKNINPKAKLMGGDTSSAIGLYLPGNGYFVLVSGASKVCSQTDAKRLASSLR